MTHSLTICQKYGILRSHDELSKRVMTKFLKTPAHSGNNPQGDETMKSIKVSMTVLVGIFVFFIVGWTLKSLSLDASVIGMLPQTSYLNWAAGNEIVYCILLGEYMFVVLLSIAIGLLCLTNILAILGLVILGWCFLIWPVTGLAVVIIIAMGFFE